MSTAILITEMLGPNWWEREHDLTALGALLDRVMEVEGCDRLKAYTKIHKETWVYEKFRGELDWSPFRICLVKALRDEDDNR